MARIRSHTLRNINDFTIQLGITRRHSYSYYGEMVKVRRVIPHPQYNELVIHDNDIALFQVCALSPSQHHRHIPIHSHQHVVCLLVHMTCSKFHKTRSSVTLSWCVRPWCVLTRP